MNGSSTICAGPVVTTVLSYAVRVAQRKDGLIPDVPADRREHNGQRTEDGTHHEARERLTARGAASDLRS